ncbi:hypothetical protein [Cellulosimicrobium aquatile]|uniref:WDGH domain-containing protein n=1 Tax=Cellulosimicrobium aquatile TaxID=1612203 RepID=UPI0014599EB0|nr:hypothetical protein [Cellulosimicrobium aquatile]NMF27937.1 hypothetical protein [Cellulosimicrobium aquatile]
MSFTVTSREGARALKPGTVARSAAGTIAGRVDSWHGAVLGDERSFPWDRLELPLTVLWPQECPTCSWPRRETVNMVCQTCGTDYAAPPTPEQTAPAELAELRAAVANGEASDGFHTHAELYAYRRVYNAALFNEWHRLGEWDVVKSWRHSDGELAFGGGWFIVVATLPTGQISNHYQAEHWNLFQIPERDLAPDYDGHTPAEALERLQEFIGPETYARGGILPAGAEPIDPGNLGGYLTASAAADYGRRLLAELNSAVVNPDCRDGKHRACSGDGWDTRTDQPAPCPCWCHATTPHAPEAGRG